MSTNVSPSSKGKFQRKPSFLRTGSNVSASSRKDAAMSSPKHGAAGAAVVEEEKLAEADGGDDDLDSNYASSDEEEEKVKQRENEKNEIAGQGQEWWRGWRMCVIVLELFPFLSCVPAHTSCPLCSMADYLLSPSTYVSSTPGLTLSSSEKSERNEVEELLTKLKQQQADLMKKRKTNTTVSEGTEGESSTLIWNAREQSSHILSTCYVLSSLCLAAYFSLGSLLFPPFPPFLPPALLFFHPSRIWSPFVCPCARHVRTRMNS